MKKTMFTTAILGVFFLFCFQNCSDPQKLTADLSQRAQGTDTGNATTPAIFGDHLASAICSRLATCSQTMDFDACKAQVLSVPNLAGRFSNGTTASLSTLQNVSQAEVQKTVIGNLNNALACSDQIAEVDCKSPQVLEILNNGGSVKYSSVPGMVPTTTSCKTVFP